jgi:transposase-like protein
MAEVVIEKRTRRRYSRGFKDGVVAACKTPGVSVAGVALAYRLNANLVRRWLAEAGVTPAKQDLAVVPQSIAGEFVPVTVAPATVPAGIRIELKRGPATVTVHWPVSAAEGLKAWLR